MASSIVDLLNLVIMVLMPFAMTIGPFGNLLSFCAFRRLSRKNKAYRYQALVILNDSFMIFFGFILVLDSLLFDIRHTTKTTISPVILFYFAHFRNVFFNTCYTAGLFIINFICLDRLEALAAPARYDKRNKKHRFIAMILLSYPIGFLSSVYEIPRYDIDKDRDSNSTYRICRNTDWWESDWDRALSIQQQLLRLLCLVTLYVLSFFVIKLYRRRIQKQVFFLRIHHPAQSQSLLKHEKTITILFMVQATATVIGMTPVMIYALITSFSDCYRSSGDDAQCQASGVDAHCQALVDIAERIALILTGLQVCFNFLIYLGFSRVFRLEMLSILLRPCICLHRLRVAADRRHIDDDIRSSVQRSV